MQRLLRAAHLLLLAAPLLVAGAVFAVPASAAYQNAVLADSPLGYWRLGEATGSFFDSSVTPGGHPGVLVKWAGGPTAGSKFYRAQPGFDGSNPDLAVDADAAPSGYAYPNVEGAWVRAPWGSDSTINFGNRAPFSVEAWVKPKAKSCAGGGCPFIGGVVGNYGMSSGGSWNVGYGVYVNWPALTVTFARSGEANGGDYDRLTTTEALSTSKWTHVVGTYDGTTMRIYFDGVEKGAMTSTRNIPTYIYGGRYFHVGKFQIDYGITEYPGAFYGGIDEAAVYTSALSQAQVINHYLANGDAAAVLAERFRPILRFDNSEKWRPLNVETFLVELFEDNSRHMVCESRSDPGENCQPIGTWRDLQLFPQAWNDQTKDDWPYIDIHGEDDDPDNYQSPFKANCDADGLRDCDANSLYTSIYWHSVGPFPTSNYRYFDYWSLYRVNWWNLPDTPWYTDLMHEGDWEGATIAASAVDPNPATFAFAALSAHGHHFHYLRPTLICDSSEDDGSCGVSSERINVFVANDTHANYPQPCSAFFGGPWCDQTAEEPDEDGLGALPEKGYDGSEPWGANDDPTALRPFPPQKGWAIGTADPSWVDWYGIWGYSEANVESPAAFRTTDVFHAPHEEIVCTERYTDPDGGPYDEDCDGSEGPTAPRAPVRPFVTPCDAWNGPHVVASVCHPATLLEALRTGTIEADGGVQLVGSALTSRKVGLGNGISQLVGAPLRPGERLRVLGRIERGTLLMVRVVLGRELTEAVFRLPSTRSATIVLGESGSASSLRIIDARGATHRPVRLHLSEGSPSTG